MKKTKNFKYVIEIKFNSRKEWILLDNKEVPYFWSKIWKDIFNITEKSIIIEANRSTKILDLDNIFTNYISSLYLQIVKSIIYYYTRIKTFKKIIQIKIELYNKKWEKEKEKILDTQSFNQVLDESFNLEFKINDSSLKKILFESKEWKELLISISNLLIWTCNNLSKTETFEVLWKSFNSLYKLITNKNKDFEALKDLKVYASNKSLPNSINLVKNLTENLREEKELIFRKMILNNYPTEKHTKALKDMIIRYNDFRLMKIFKNTKLCYREKFLKEKWYYDEVLEHIEYNINNNTINNKELIFFLTWIYMYFIRNKQFHWENLNHNFRLTTNKFDIQYEFLNSILKAYIVDLINNQ